MSSPIPPKSISGGCSVISNNTLYVYSADAFQALPLRSGGNWTELQNGIAVTGAVCAKGMVGGNNTGEALWIVGGAEPTSNSNYPGLQRYSFADQSWETITPEVRVTQNRQNHAAVFLNESQSILVYAGSQNDKSVASSQTFLISTFSPYTVRSYTAENSPALSPLLFQWGNNTAISLGGSGNLTAIYHFGPENGWKDFGTSLDSDMNSTTVEQGILLHNSDNSKVLELYDLGVTPNTITNVVLQDADGNIAPTGQTVGTTVSRKRKRLTLTDWPNYNATYAPTTTRSGYTVAQDTNGLVAFSGGNAQNPVGLFNSQTNGWVDTSNFFGLSDTSTGTSTSSATTTPTSTSAAAGGSSNNSNHHHTSLILGATLGSILGFIALLIIVLLFIRWRRRKRRESHVTTASDEKHRLSFADRGAPFMREAGGAGAVTGPLDLGDPFIVTATEGIKRTSRSIRSESSNAPLVPHDRANMNPNSVELSPIREKGQRDPNRPFAKGERGVPSIILEQDSPRNSAKSIQLNNRGSGWSGYFLGTSDRLTPAGKDAIRASGLTPRNSTHETGDTYLNYDPMRPTTVASSNHDCSTHGPTEIPPLKLGQEWDSSRMSQAVVGGSVAPLASTMPSRAPSATGNRTISSRTSTEAPSTMGDTVFTHEDNHWTPVTKSDWTKTPTKTLMRDTKSSSFYGDDATSGPRTPSRAIVAAAPSMGGMASGLRKSDGSFWGEPGPEEVVEEGSPTLRTPTRKPRKGGNTGGVDDDDDDEGEEMKVATPVTLSRPERSVVGNGDMSWLKIGS